MKQDELLSSISADIEVRDLWRAIKHMENYLALHPHQINSDRLFAIKTDYQMMMDYWRKGYKDPQQPQQYEKLLHRMYVLYANVTTNARVLQSPLLASLLMKVHMSPRDWSIQVVREQLESFVSDIAMLDLEPKHTAQERRKNLHRQHHQLLSELFAYILTADLWSDGQGEEIEQLLLSPTVDSFDQQVIISASGGIKIVALFLTMLTCIVLGMGVPTTANYVIMATTCAPVLIRMGIPSIAAHMFVFYFGIVADITPPVALAAYAGSAIAHASPMKTGVNATKLAIAAFIIPYMLALNPAMVFVDTTALEVISIVITSLAGMFGLSMALEGFYHGGLSALLRIVSAVGGLLLIYPGLATDLVGLLLVGGVIAFQLLREKKAAAA